MKKAWLITAAALTAAGLFLCTGALIAAGFDPARLDAAGYATNTYTPGESFQWIEIDSREGDVFVMPSENGRCTVTCLEREKVKHRVTVEDGTLKIKVQDKREWYDHLSLFSRELSVTVYLPRERYEVLTVKGGTGDVTVSKALTFGRIDLDCSTGDVTCSASAEKMLRIKGSTGDVKLKDFSAGEMEIALSTGNILGSALRCGRVDLEVRTGDIELTDLQCVILHAAGSTGDVKLRKVFAMETMRVETDTGDVRLDGCDGGEMEIMTSTGDVTGTLRSDKVFIPRTSTGSVRVPDSTTGGTCRITTSTGDINIKIK